MQIHLSKGNRQCPCCHQPLDGATGERQPRDGDISVCAYCASVVFFRKTKRGWHYEEASDVTLQVMEKEDSELYRRVMMAVKAIKMIKKIEI